MSPPRPVDPASEMTRILDRPPTPVVLTRGDATATITKAWTHGALHDQTAPMAEHVFMTYLGAARSIERRSEHRMVRAETRRGTVTLIPANAVARWDISGEISVVHFYVTPNRLQRFAEQNELSSAVELVERTATPDETGSYLLTKLAEAAAGPSRSDSLFAAQAAELVCAHLLRAHSQFGQPQPSQPRGGLAPWQVKRITDYLEAHLADDITLADIAGVLDLSPWHLCRAFRQSTGLPPHRWRAARRVERAREMLTATRMPLIEIAIAVGYEGASQFSAAFRNATGMSPSEYRSGQNG